LVFLPLLLSAPASAQQPRPPSQQPGQIERQFKKPPEPKAQPEAVTIPEEGQPRPANADRIRFVLNDLTLEGVTAYPMERLRPVYAGLLHQDVSLADIYQAVDTLTARYRNDGYILSQVIVPAQTVDSGVVKLRAIEGYIAAVTVDGGSQDVRERVLALGEKIRASRPLTAAVLERNVLLMNDLPGVRARAVLAPSAVPGASDLVLQVTNVPRATAFTADNRGSRSQGQQRLVGDGQFYSLFGGASATEVLGATSVNPELFFLSVSHTQFVGSAGGRIGVAASYAYSKPQELEVVPLHLITNSTTTAVSYIQPLIRRRARNLSVRAAFTTFDSRSDIFDVEDSADRLRAIRLGLTFDTSDRLNGVTIADFEFSQGINGLGASTNGDQYLSRPLGRADFRKVTLYSARMQTLHGNWSLFLAGSGQYAFTDLLSPELFSFGGELFGRGYDPSELLNDHGIAGRVDLQYAHTSTSHRRLLLLPYAFFDAGKVWQRTPLPGIPSSDSATSAGGGLRLTRGPLSGFIEIAKPLDHVVLQEGNRDPRFYVGFSVR
jgi:hemolysin activation/secretion protein